MLPSKHPLPYSLWLYGLILTTILIFSLQPSDVAAHPQQTLIAPSHLSSDLAASSAQESAETAYHLQPLATSAQDAGEAGQSYLGLNPAQALRFEFTPRGLDISAQPSGDLAWHLGWKLADYTREGTVSAAIAAGAANTVVAGNRIEYQYGNFTEWYVNEARGLKHGFTLAQPPSAPNGEVPLQLRLQVDGTLTPVVNSNGQAVDFVTAKGASLLRYDGLYVFDAQQTTLPAFFSVAENGIVINVDDSQAVYPITIDPLLTSYLEKRTATDTAAGDNLGYDVNVSQEVAIVGAHHHFTDTGAVYLYQAHLGGSHNWGQIPVTLRASDGEEGDRFGQDVYITFGVTATVGAPGKDGETGAAYIYGIDRDGAGMWGEIAKITANDGAPGDQFGAAVAAQSRTLVVGAPGKNGNEGAAYVFVQESADITDWGTPTNLPGPGVTLEPGNRFGAAVVVSGDIIAIGAPGNDSQFGVVYVYERISGNSNQWSSPITLTAESPTPGDLFGSSLNFSNDRIIVGAPGEAGMGAAYIYEPDSDTGEWTQRARLVAPDGAAGDEFGRSVGIGGNIAIIGAPGDDDNGDNSGSAYLAFFRVSGEGEWGNIIKVNAADGAGGDRFGFSVDQRAGHIVIGAPMEDDAGENAGAAYFYNTPFNVGTLQVASNVEPNDPSTNWNYTIEGPLTHEDSLTGDSQTAPAMLFPGTYTVTESAGAGTDLSLYSTSWSCTTDGTPSGSGTGSTLTVFVGANQNVVCNFIHNVPGSITIQKVATPADDTSFEFTDNIEDPNSFTLSNGESHTFSNVTPGTYEITEDVPDGWRLDSISCPTGDTSVSGNGVVIELDADDSVTCTFANKIKAGVTVHKTADVSAASVGQTITYRYHVINDSVDPLDIVAVDDKLGAVTFDQPTLPAGEEMTGTLSYVVQESDLPGPLQNTVTVTGTSPSETVTDDDNLSIVLIGDASIALSVTANPTSAGVDDTVNYSYRITNTGSTPLNDVQVVDDRLGQVSLVDTSLQPGESTSGTLIYLVKQEDLPGPLVNTVNATGQTPSDQEVMATATVSVELIEESQPGISVSVSASTNNAKVGDTITYTYVVRNSGAETLTDVTATDNRLGAVTLEETMLEPGESTTGTKTYVVVESDLPGPLVNSVTAQGTSSDGDVESEATVSVTLDSSDPDPDPDPDEPRLNLPLIFG